jgi:hypothetical protein
MKFGRLVDKYIFPGLIVLCLFWVALYLFFLVRAVINGTL